MTARDRYQLVIALGTAVEGSARHAKLEHAAKGAGQTLSAWSRDVLLRAAGEPLETPPTRGEHQALAARVARLEDLLGLEGH